MGGKKQAKGFPLDVNAESWTLEEVVRQGAYSFLKSIRSAVNCQST